MTDYPPPPDDFADRVRVAVRPGRDREAERGLACCLVGFILGAAVASGAFLLLRWGVT